MRGTLETQLELEADMMTGGIDRFRKARDKAVASGMESNTLHGRVIVSRIVEDVAKGILDLQQNPKSNRDITYARIKDMDAEQVAYLAVVSLVDAISKKSVLLHAAQSIGGNLEIQDRLDRWVQSEGSIAKNTIKLAMKKAYGARRYGLTHKMNKDGFKDTEWTKPDRIHVGLRMIDLIIVHTGIVELTKQVTARNKTVTVVKATKGTEDWIKAFNDYAETAKPRYAPCIIVPKDWTDVTGGGYHGAAIDELPIVRRR
jgi:DNA-directed RNA polymerase